VARLRGTLSNPVKKSSNKVLRIMAKKVTGNTPSHIASEVLRGKTPSPSQVRTLAGSVLSQDETRGPQKKK
jgi:hypothetical protein